MMERADRNGERGLVCKLMKRVENIEVMARSDI